MSDLAQFAGLVFQILAPLQLALAVFFSAMLAVSAVAQEKDRRTFVLLLLTNLSDRELVLGKLLASLLHVLVMFAAGLPVFMLLALLGGISSANRPHGGSHRGQHPGLRHLGSTLALWRERPFRPALFVLILVLWLAVARCSAAWPWERRPAGLTAHVWATAVSPCRRSLPPRGPPRSRSPGCEGLGSPIDLYLLVAAALAVLLNGLAVLRVRTWNAAGREEAVRKERRKSG